MGRLPQGPLSQRTATGRIPARHRQGRAVAGVHPTLTAPALRLHRGLAEGIPNTEVSRWLGHKSIEVTHQIYGHLVPSSFDRARTALDAAYHESRRQPPRSDRS